MQDGSRPTHKEKVLNPSQFSADGSKEWFRGSQQLPDGSFSEDSNFRSSLRGIKNWLLQFILIPPFSIQAQSRWTQTDPTKIDYIKEKSLTITVASLRALAGNYNPDVWYIVTDAVGSFGILRIRARDVNILEKQGTLTKGGKSYTVEYSIDDGAGNDAFTYWRDDINNNTAYNYFDIPAFIPSIPLDGTWNSNIFYVSNAPSISDASKFIMSSNHFDSGCLLSLNHNGSASVPSIQVNNTYLGAVCSLNITANSAGGLSTVDGLTAIGTSLVVVNNGASIAGTLICEACVVTVDDNGADGTTILGQCNIYGSTQLNIKGVTGGVGTTLTGCSIGGFINFVEIKGGESYQKKILTPAESTFDGSRTIIADGAFDFIDSALVANYNRSFIGIWTVTAAAPHNVTSFINRDVAFSHHVTFILGAGSSTMTFVDNGVDIIMKSSANAALANEGDYVTFRFVGQVGYEVDRGIY